MFCGNSKYVSDKCTHRLLIKRSWAVDGLLNKTLLFFEVVIFFPYLDNLKPIKKEFLEAVWINNFTFMPDWYFEGTNFEKITHDQNSMFIQFLTKALAESNL